MKKVLLLILALVGGTAVGGGAAYGTSLIAGPREHAAADADAGKADENTAFVPTSKILAPLVMADGRLAGYVSFEVQLQVPADKADFVTQRLPLLLNAINLRTYRTPPAAGPDGMLPDIAAFRTVVMAAAPEASGAGVVRLAAITQAQPA